MPSDQKKNKQQADTSNQADGRPAGLSMDDWMKVASMYAKNAQDETARFARYAQDGYDRYANEARNMYGRAQRVYESLPAYGEAAGRLALGASEYYPSLTNRPFVDKAVFGVAKVLPYMLGRR
jgi:hypothetical protein